MRSASEHDVSWPTLRSKLWPITVIRLSFWTRPRLEFRNWYHGNYWGIEFGPWIILGGACVISESEAAGQ